MNALVSMRVARINTITLPRKLLFWSLLLKKALQLFQVLKIGIMKHGNIEKAL